MGLPVCHILEPEQREVVPADVYEENVGIWVNVADAEEIGRRFKSVREKAAQLPTAQF